MSPWRRRWDTIGTMGLLSAADDVLDRLVLPSFSAIGPAVRRRVFRWETPDLTGRRIAVTGPTSGLGEAAALGLAGLGAEVVLVARNLDKAQRVRNEIAGRHGGTTAIVQLDLADLDSVRRAGAELAALDHLDGLVHNGGALFDERAETVDGIERTLAIHVVAPFALTAAALPALARSASARVVWVASGGMYGRALDVADLQSQGRYNGTAAYARAKRAQVVLARRWADRLTPAGILVHAMHPGWVDTPGLTESLPRFGRILGPLLREPADGADTIVWLCGAPAAEVGTGRFWLDRRPRPTAYLPGTTTGDDDARRLWDRVAALAGVDPDIAPATGPSAPAPGGPVS